MCVVTSGRQRLDEGSETPCIAHSKDGGLSVRKAASIPPVHDARNRLMRNITVGHHPLLCLPSVCLMTLHVTRSPRPSSLKDWR